MTSTSPHRPLSRRLTLGLSLLTLGALVSVAWTANTAWWPWTSEAFSPPASVMQQQVEDLKKLSEPAPAQPEGGSEQTACTADTSNLIDPCADLATNIQNVYKESISLMLLLAFLVLVYAGYRYITSLGNPEATKDAKDWAVSAITGIALLLLIPLIMQALGVGSPSSSTSGTPGSTTPPLDSSTPEIPQDQLPA